MALSRIKKVPLGGGLSIVAATFTATAGAADQTLVLGACRVLLANVNPQVTVEPVDFRGDLYDVSTAGGLTTVTIRTESGITAGTFVAIIDEGGV